MFNILGGFVFTGNYCTKKVIEYINFTNSPRK